MNHCYKWSNIFDLVSLQMTNEMPLDIIWQLGPLPRELLNPILSENPLSGITRTPAKTSAGWVFDTATRVTAAGSRPDSLAASTTARRTSASRPATPLSCSIIVPSPVRAGRTVQLSPGVVTDRTDECKFL